MLTIAIGFSEGFSYSCFLFPGVLGGCFPHFGLSDMHR